MGFLEHMQQLQPQQEAEQKEEEQPQQSYSSFEGYEEDQLTKYQLEFNEIIKALKQALSGKTWNNNTKKWEFPYQDFKPIINEEGLHYLVGEIVPLITKNTKLSNLSKAEIVSITKEKCRTMTKVLTINMHSFGIEQLSHVESLVFNAGDLIFVTLNMAEDGMTALNIKTMVKAVEHHQQFMPEQKRGFLAKFGG